MRCTLALCILLLMQLSNAVGQDEVVEPSGELWLGLDVRHHWSIDNAAIQVYGVDPGCGEFHDGEGRSWRFGAWLIAPSLWTTTVGPIESIGVSASVGVTRRSARLTTVPTTPTPVPNPDVGGVYYLDREFVLDAYEDDLSLDLNPIRAQRGDLSLSVGMSIGLRLDSRYRAVDTVVAPPPYSFAGGLRSRPIEGFIQPTGAFITLSPVASISWTPTIGNSRRLAITASYQRDLLSRVVNRQWNREEIGVGLSFLFDVTPEVIPPPPPPPRLAAAIDLFAIDANGERMPVPRVRVHELLFRQHAPLVPALFFEKDAATIASRYVSLTSQQADSFDVDRLAGSGVLDIHHQLLNLLGLRLRQHPSAHITIVGSESSEERQGVAHERAENVRRYLIDVWKIEPHRLQVVDGRGTMQRSKEATEDGRADNRRVEVIASDPAILVPVVTENVVRDFDPPIIQMDPLYRADAGMREWTLRVVQDGREVVRYTSADADAGRTPELTWNLMHDEGDSVLAPLIAELVVTDSTGASVTATNEVPIYLEHRRIAVDKRIELHGDRVRASYSIVAFDFNSSELTDSHERELREIAREVRPGAKVVVTGFTDRIGDDRYNAELARERATNVAAALRERLAADSVSNVDVTVVGGGVDRQRFENDLPEGRVFSRGVTVVVEQPVGGTEGRGD